VKRARGTCFVTHQLLLQLPPAATPLLLLLQLQVRFMRLISLDLSFVPACICLALKRDVEYAKVD